MSEQLPQQTTVLIVGAGPTGLATALSLIHHDIHDIVVVDAVLSGQNSSRAIVVHSATIEALDTIDCASALIARSFKAKSAQIRSRTSFIFSGDFSSLAPYTRFPFALIVPQSITEQVLGEKLASFGKHVYRPHTVASVECNKSNSTLTDVTFADGQVISAKYVVGADGARSAIRTAAGIPFNDPDGETLDCNNILSQMVLADIVFKDSALVPDMDGVNIILHSAGFFLIVPLPSGAGDLPEHQGKSRATQQDKIYRIGCGIPSALWPPPHAPGQEYLQSLLDVFGPITTSGKLEIKEVMWSTRFRTHSAIADTFFTRLGGGEDGKQGGMIFLVGDAAHIHSPIGGQGMNLGIRDAVGLGEVLSTHISQSQPSDTILTMYAAARHERALQVIALTKTLLSCFEPRWPWVLRWLDWVGLTLARVRDALLMVAGKSEWVRGMAALRLSGLGMR